MRPGLRFSWLETICATNMKKWWRDVWVCRCTRCGNLALVDTGALLYGDNVSCGCYKRDNSAKIGRNAEKNLHFVDGTCVERIANQKAQSNNTSGFRGISKTKNNVWKVTIQFKGVRQCLGCFRDFEAAKAARLAAEERLYKPFLDEFYANDEPLEIPLRLAAR